MSLGLFCLLITITIIQWTNSQLLDMKCLPSGTTPCIHTISSQEKSEVKEKCGKKSPSLSKGYIVDGQEIEWNSAPWTAAIVDKNNKFVSCTGVVISQRHLLTASHCFWHKKKVEQNATTKYQIWYGSQCLLGIAKKCPKGAPGLKKYNIRSIYYPKKFESDKTTLDFAIVEIKDKFDFTGSNRPLCFFGASINMSKLGEKEKWINNTCDTPDHLIEVGFSGTRSDKPAIGEGILREFDSLVDKQCHHAMLCTKSWKSKQKLPSTTKAMCRLKGKKHYTLIGIHVGERARPEDEHVVWPGHLASSFVPGYDLNICRATNVC